jgi:aldose 1-epimerase
MDQEITLSYKSQRAVVAPLGAALRRYYEIGAGGQEIDIAWGYSGADHKMGGQGDILMPFPSRIKNARYTFQGQTHQLEVNDKAGNNAIHGFVRSVIWNAEPQGTSAIRFTTALRKEDYASKGYPFSLDMTLDYRVDDNGLACAFTIRNAGDGAAPAGAGFHPYFVAGTETVDELEARLPANRYLEFEKTLTPTGKLLSVDGTPLDFREFRKVGDTIIDNCYTDLIADADGCVRSSIRNPATGRTVTVWMEPVFPYLVVFTGDTIPEPGKRKALALEPMTCATDAFNHPEWGLAVLQPGEELRGRFGVQANG